MKIQPKGNSYDGSMEYNEKQNHTLIIIGIIGIIAIIIGCIYFFSSHSKKCNTIEQTILKAAEKYVKDKNLLPVIEGESITVTVDDLFTEHTKPTLKENICNGTITFTKYKEEYVKEYNITNCGYCSTDEHWSAETDKFPKDKKNIQVIPYYNYYEVSVYNSEWSDWIESKKVTEKNNKYNITLPDEKLLPEIPSEGNILRYEKETKTYYSYRDKLYRFYRDNGGSYSEYSSEQPAGYSKYDYNTEIETEWSNWSLNYPEKKSYRTISSTKGYRWYYEKDGKKYYWNSGTYAHEQPEEKYNKHEKESVTMYRYKDKLWRWYNGNKRDYSGFKATPESIYTIKDTGYSTYTNWSSFTDSNKIDNTNSSYREQITDTYSRFRIVYKMKTFLRLDTYVSKQEFEEKLQATVPELMKKENLLIDIQYKFKYRK